MRVFVPAAAALALASTLAVVDTSPTVASAATTASCIPGRAAPVCTIWTGKVTTVHDGDTLSVDVDGDGTTTPIRVRVTGINAMEQSVYSSDPAKRRGACHALEATARFEQLVRLGGGVVKLTAQDASSQSAARMRRSVAVKIDGTWRDVGRVMLREGRALWLANGVEYAWNATYQHDLKYGQTARLGLWDTDRCGDGPSQSAPLSVRVHWDAEGSDGANLNGEWVQVRNLSGAAVPIGGWWMRDSHLRRFTFPAGASIPARGSVTVFVGTGTNTATKFFWNRSAPVFDNVSRDARAMGDGGYLFDVHGDVRAWLTYPCVGNCSDALRGALNVTAQPSGAEYVDVKNISTRTVNLAGYLVVNEPYDFPILRSTVLNPGQTLRLYVGSGTNSALVRYWRKSSSILNNDGDVVSVRTYDDIAIDCHSWGSARC